MAVLGGISGGSYTQVALTEGTTSSTTTSGKTTTSTGSGTTSSTSNTSTQTSNSSSSQNTSGASGAASSGTSASNSTSSSGTTTNVTVAPSVADKTGMVSLQDDEAQRLAAEEAARKAAEEAGRRAAAAQIQKEKEAIEAAQKAKEEAARKAAEEAAQKAKEEAAQKAKEEAEKAEKEEAFRKSEAEEAARRARKAEMTAAAKQAAAELEQEQEEKKSFMETVSDIFEKIKYHNEYTQEVNEQVLLEQVEMVGETMEQLWENYRFIEEQKQATEQVALEGIKQWNKIIGGDAGDLTEEDREALHIVLDIMSSIADVGVFEWMNAELYAAEGNTTMAAASTVAVALPAVIPATKHLADKATEVYQMTKAVDLMNLALKTGSIDELAESMIQYGDELQEAGEVLTKQIAEATGEKAVKEAVEGGADVLNNLKPQNLMDELASSGVKYNPDDVIAVTKTADGKLLWLEQGNTKSGLTHILERHADDFASQGIDDIPQLLKDVLKNTPIKTGSNSKGLFADYVLNGNTYRVAYGTNGYIVSFYPIDEGG